MPVSCVLSTSTRKLPVYTLISRPRVLRQTKYAKQAYATKYTGTKPVLVVCTDEGLMPMKNGRTFSTGNHPVEMFVPMLHFWDAQKSVEAKLRKCSQNYNPESDTSG